MNCFDNVRRKCSSPFLDKALALLENRNRLTACSVMNAQSFMTARIVSLESDWCLDERKEVRYFDSSLIHRKIVNEADVLIVSDVLTSAVPCCTHWLSVESDWDDAADKVLGVFVVRLFIKAWRFYTQTVLTVVERLFDEPSLLTCIGNLSVSERSTNSYEAFVLRVVMHSWAISRSVAFWADASALRLSALDVVVASEMLTSSFASRCLRFVVSIQQRRKSASEQADSTVSTLSSCCWAWSN